MKKGGIKTRVRSVADKTVQGNKNLFEKHTKYCIHKLVWMPIKQLKIIYSSSLKLSHNWLFPSLWSMRRALWKSIWDVSNAVLVGAFHTLSLTVLESCA